MGSFETFGGVVVVEQVGKIPYAYIVRTEEHQVAILNNRNANAEVSCVYQCHTFTGDVPDRERVKRITRVKVYGEGSISGNQDSGVMTVIADNVRSDIYIYSALAADPQEGALWAQYCLALKGRAFDIKIELVGTGLRIREVSMEYVVIN